MSLQDDDHTESRMLHTSIRHLESSSITHGSLSASGLPNRPGLLSCSPAEWIQVMDRQDVLVAALELQRDAGLMASKMSTEVLQLVFGQELFPSHVVDDAAPVPRVHRGWMRHLIVMTVRVVPNARRGYPVEQLQSTSMVCRLSCSEETFLICNCDYVYPVELSFKT